MENEPRRGDSVTPHTGFRGSRSCTISIIDSVQFQIIDDTRANVMRQREKCSEG